MLAPSADIEKGSCCETPRGTFLRRGNMQELPVKPVPSNQQDKAVGILPQPGLGQMRLEYMGK
jgi:hypothetical protein